MGPKKLRVHKGMVPCPGTRSRHQAQIFSPRRQAEPHPQGNSAVINIKP